MKIKFAVNDTVTVKRDLMDGSCAGDIGVITEIQYIEESRHHVWVSVKWPLIGIIGYWQCELVAATPIFGVSLIDCSICNDRHIHGMCGLIFEESDPEITTAFCENCGTMFAGKNGYSESMADSCCKSTTDCPQCGSNVITELLRDNGCVFCTQELTLAEIDRQEYLNENTVTRIYAASMFSSTGFMTCLASNLPEYAINDARYFLAQWEYQVSDYINGRDLNSAQELIDYAPITLEAINAAINTANYTINQFTRKQGSYTSLAVGRWARNKMPAIMRQKLTYKSINSTDIADFNTHYGILAIWRKQDNTEALKAIAIPDYTAPVKRAIHKH